jgi:hypothetical protein
MGYIALNKKTGLIVDVFARTKNEIYTIVLNTIKYLYKIKEQNSLPFHEIKIMKSPLISEILENPLFYKIDFKFAFAVYLLDKNADLNSFESHNWFMMPND